MVVSIALRPLYMGENRILSKLELYSRGYEAQIVSVPNYVDSFLMVVIYTTRDRASEGLDPLQVEYSDALESHQPRDEIVTIGAAAFETVGWLEFFVVRHEL